MDTHKANFQYSMLSLSLPPDHKAPTGTKDRGLSVFVSQQPLPDRIRKGHVCRALLAAQRQLVAPSQAANFYCTSASLHSYLREEGDLISLMIRPLSIAKATV